MLTTYFQIEFKVYFMQFHMSHTMYQIFIIRGDIHISPVGLSPMDWRWVFYISFQSYVNSPIRAYSHPIFDWFLKAPDTWYGIGGER